jgi:hypothetical protein
MRDPPVDPDHDVDDTPPVRRAGEPDGIETPDPSPDRVLYDENRAVG